LKPNYPSGGVGPTNTLSLRVSVASLVSVLFQNPENGKTILALERTAILRKNNGETEIIVKAKPFGGGVRLTNPRALKKLIGNFNYDSERSSKEHDFRIQINPDSWKMIIKICNEHWMKIRNEILDPSPERELAEEFEDSLGIQLTPNDYSLRPKGMLVDDKLNETSNVNAPGISTVRVYYLFDAVMKNPEIIQMMLDNSNIYSDEDLKKTVLEDARQGGKGRANAILSVVLEDLQKYYSSLPNDKRSGLISYGEHQLNGNVQTILGLLIA